MSEQILKVSDDFWNIRGDFKIGGVLNIGTHTSLVRRGSGKFVLLDAYTMRGKTKEQVDTLTNDGADIEAIINLHPFHTVHVRKVHSNIRLRSFTVHNVMWTSFRNCHGNRKPASQPNVLTLFADDFEFSVPAGVDFISSNEHLHFSSVLAYHKASKDDSLGRYLNVPEVAGSARDAKAARSHVSLHACKDAGEAATGGRGLSRWARQLAAQWSDAENLCAAHSAALLGRDNRFESIADRILRALGKVEKTLQLHQKKFG